MVKTRCKIYDFRGADAPPAVASRQGTWCSKITAAAGSPTIKSVSGGTLDLALDATSEVQNLCLYQGDILPFKIQDLIRLEIVASVSASLDASVSAAFGLAAARHDTLDSVTAHSWFRLQGSNALLVETDDGTNDNDDKATGITMGTALKRFAIDFTGVQTRQLPSSSLGNRANVAFFADNSGGDLRRVADTTLFDMSNYSATSGLQLFAQIQKTAGTAVGTLSIESFEVEYKVR
jgi:hypothetical protein